MSDREKTKLAHLIEQQKAEIERLQAKLAEHQEIVEALAAAIPKLYEIGGRVYCRFCMCEQQHGPLDHGPNCPWLKAKELVEKETP